MSPIHLPNHVVLLLSDDNVGLGVAIDDLDVLVCTEKSVRNIDNIRYEYQDKKGVLEVIYCDELNNVSFCNKPEFLSGVTLNDTKDEDVPKDDFYHHEFKIQGQPIIKDDKLYGLISYPIIQSELVSFIPSNVIMDSYLEWKKSGVIKGIKCPSCNTINDNKIGAFKCFKCNYQIKYDNSDIYPAPITARIEKIIASAGYNPDYTRRGFGMWCLSNNDTNLELTYHQRTGSFLAQIKIGRLDGKTMDTTLSYLMKQNYHNKELTLSIKDDFIYLILTLFDDYLDDHTTKNSLNKMLKLGKNYKEVIRSLNLC